MMENCLCDNNKSFDKYCEPFLKENEIAKTPKQLMRSRYTAYALGDHGEYLLSTWLPESSKDLTVIALSKKTHEWVKLEVLSSSQKGNEDQVEFNAYYKCDDSEINVLHEKFTFRRVGRHWYYVEDVMETNI